MKVKSISSLLFCISVICLSHQLIAKAATLQEYSFISEKTIDVNSSITIDITNKYGKVTIVTWDKDQVYTKATITGRDKDKDNAEKQAKKISMQTLSTTDKLSIFTNFNSTANNAFGYLKDLMSPFNSSQNVSIDYEIMVPKKIRSLSIQNSFGDILLNEVSFPVNITLNYGNLIASSINNNFNLDLSFGNAQLGKINYGVCSISYAKLNIDKVKQLTITKSNFSNISIGEVETMAILKDSYGKIFVSGVNRLNINSYFSTIHASSVYEKININASMGDIKIDKLETTFKECAIAAKFGSTYIGLVSVNNFKIEASTNLGNIEYDRLMFKNAELKEDSHTSKSLHVPGNCEENCNTINVTIDKGSLHLYQAH